jgi:pSer/pThr/pTyr-binding forkhead associated (FHA) protein
MDGGKTMVRDGGSRHGTYVNGEKVSGEREIRAGDVLTLGPGGPAFLIEEVGRATSGAPTTRPVQSPGALDDVGPTDVRAAVSVSEQPTPSMDQVAFRKPTASRPGGAIALKRPRRRTPLVWVTAIILIVAATAFLTTRSSGGTDTTPNTLLTTDLQAATTEVTRLKSSLDSVVAAGASSAEIDSLRQALASAESTATVLEDSLKRLRPPER